MKRFIYMMLAIVWVAAAVVASPCAAEEKKESPSVGEAVGSSARQVADDSKTAYQETKETIVKVSKDVVQGAKNAFQEAKESGTHVAEDVKAGFTKEQPSKDVAPCDAPKTTTPEKTEPKK
ncbi:MAG: hypothetical protein WAU91_16515 [Desulfatitalea sp.]